MVTSPGGRRPDGRNRFLPPVYREPLKPRVRALDPARPALRLVTIGLLTVLSCLLGIGIAWVILL